MNAILYHQKMKDDLRGRKIYIGEDAYPYADDQIIIVADGLGGRGGYPHTKINPKILEKDAFYDVVFAPVFSGSVSDDFKSFIIDSFKEIFETKDYYFENSATTRSSGYFASRLVTAIALYELKYNDCFKKENIFPRIQGMSKEQLPAFVQQLGDQLAGLLLNKLSIIAANVGFEVETKISGAYLLPSTLTVALVNERENDADVIYFWAGDSRGYLWDVNGLGQVTEDHEKDETMTNLITLTKPFRIESRYVNVTKPCLLFNATDGCYKCPVFDSPFDLEYIFLKAIDESADFDIASNYLANQFAEIGRHDDSNTLSLLSLGFENYDSIQSMVRERLRVIDETIISKLPGILQINYPAELQQIEEQMNESLFAVKDQLITHEPIVSYVKNNMESGEYRPFVKEMEELIEQSNVRIARQKELLAQLKLWIQKHWIEYPQMKKYSPAAHTFKGGFLGFGKKDPFEQYAELRERLNSVKEEHARSIQDAIDKLKATNSQIELLLNGLIDIKQANSFDYNTFSDEKNAMLQLMDFIKSVSKRDTPAMVKYKAVVREIKELNQMYVTFDAAAVEIVFNSVVLGTFDPRNIKMHPSEFATIDALLKEIVEIKAEIVSLDKEMNGLSDKYLLSYWNDRSEQLILQIWKEHRTLIPESLVATISDGMVGLKAKQVELQYCCETREKLYMEYDVTYRRLYEESKI